MPRFSSPTKDKLLVNHIIQDESSDDGGFKIQDKLRNNLKSINQSEYFTTTSSRTFDSILTSKNDSSILTDTIDNSFYQIEPKLRDLIINRNIKEHNCDAILETKESPLRTLSCQNTYSSTDMLAIRSLTNTPHNVKQEENISKDNNNMQLSKSNNIHTEDKNHELISNQSQKTKSIYDIEISEEVSKTTKSIDIDSISDCQTYEDEDDESKIVNIRSIKKQLQGLENLYLNTIKRLQKKKNGNRFHQREFNDRISKKFYGSMSSVPSSSISSKPFRELSSKPIREYNRRRTYLGHDDKRKFHEIKGIQKRFQILESHVITLARSIAQLSTEMRAEHVMIQEIETIKSDLSQLKSHVSNLFEKKDINRNNNQWIHNYSSSFADFTTPQKVKKLKNFFGDDPPLLRLFLRKLGYEKYAHLFEKEKIGIIELPYLNEDRMEKLGIPLGPRLRILKEVQQPICSTLCIV